MEEIPFVKPEEAELAREMERRLLEIRDDAGVLFVGVSVRPTVAGEAPIFFIWLGCKRSTSEDMMGPLVDHLFREEILKGVQIKVEAHRGCILP